MTVAARVIVAGVGFVGLATMAGLARAGQRGRDGAALPGPGSEQA